MKRDAVSKNSEDKARIASAEVPSMSMEDLLEALRQAVNGIPLPYDAYIKTLSLIDKHGVGN